MSLLAPLTKKSLLLLFAYAPIGLGHLRVTEALYRGLPKNSSPLLLSSQDKTVSYIYRIMSVHTFTRNVLEKLQQGIAQEFTTPLYRWYLRNHTDLLYQQINTIIDQSIAIPDQILLVATHFGLAHQATAIKQKIIADRKIDMKIVVQVTDDTPQQIWYVPGADIIFVPSERIKDRLETYVKSHHLPPVRFEVNPYPISPNLNTNLPPSRLDHRESQLDPQSDTTIHFSIPISGAAVGMDFVKKVTDFLHLKSKRFFFHVVSKNAPFTHRFIHEMSSRPDVEIRSSVHDKEVIEIYERLYQDATISLEITKPSEQTFKALINPYKCGGAILLFSKPVGKQEHDNLHFLRRHGLIPLKSTQHDLWQMAKSDLRLEGAIKNHLLSLAKSWRGLDLPYGSKDAGQFIWWCFREKILLAMLSCKDRNFRDRQEEYELRPDGVDEFWRKTAALLTPANS